MLPQNQKITAAIAILNAIANLPSGLLQKFLALPVSEGGVGASSMLLGSFKFLL